MGNKGGGGHRIKEGHQSRWYRMVKRYTVFLLISFSFFLNLIFINLVEASTSLCIGGTPFAVLTQTGSASNAFDGDISGGTYWEGYRAYYGSSAGAAIGYHFPSPIIINFIALWQGKHGSAYTSGSSNLQIQGSNDGVHYSVIASITPSLPSSYSEQDISFTNSTAYSYYRLYNPTNTVAHYWYVDELDMYYFLLPSPPTELSVSINGSSVILSWAANPSNDNVASYEVYIDDVDQCSLSSSTLAYTINNLSLGNHSFYVTATNSVGTSSPSGVFNFSVSSAPSGLSAGNVTSTSYTLYWQKQSDVTSYNVYLDGTLTGNVLQPLLNNPSLDISNLSEGSTHFMTVTSVSQSGESAASQPLTVTLLPSTPTGLQSLNITTNSLDLSWPTSGGATSYIIFKDGTQLATTTSTSYHISNLNPSTGYNFQIAAVNSAGQSPQSDAVNVTTLGIPPLAPTGLSAGELTNTSFTLYWLKQSDAASYNVYIDGTLAGTVSQPLLYNPSFDNSNLTDGSTHSMTVTAINQWGESTASLPISVTTSVQSPLLTATIDNSKINLMWTGAGSSFKIMVDGKLIEEVSSSPYTITEKPGTYQIQIIQNYNGQQYPSNIVSVTISALQNVGAAQMTGDIISTAGIVIAPVGGLLALALALKGSPMILAAAKTLFLKS